MTRQDDKYLYSICEMFTRHHLKHAMKYVLTFLDYMIDRKSIITASQKDNYAKEINCVYKNNDKVRLGEVC